MHPTRGGSALEMATSLSEATTDRLQLLDVHGVEKVHNRKQPKQDISRACEACVAKGFKLRAAAWIAGIVAVDLAAEVLPD